jgi:hypothetical protein
MESGALDAETREWKTATAPTPQNPARKPPMQQMNSDELADLVTQLELSTEETRDELLTDFLVRPYPTKGTQDN